MVRSSPGEEGGDWGLGIGDWGLGIRDRVRYVPFAFCLLPFAFCLKNRPNHPRRKQHHKRQHRTHVPVKLGQKGPGQPKVGDDPGPDDQLLRFGFGDKDLDRGPQRPRQGDHAQAATTCPTRSVVE